MNPIGLSLEKAQLITKYGFEFSFDTVKKDLFRLTNQTWKLIPMFENGENWEKQLDTVIIEISGLNEIFISQPLFLQLLSKLEGIRLQNDIKFELFRKTVFEIISLIQELIRVRL